MLKKLHAITSAANLTKAGPRGQIATILTLLMVALLVFMLVIANLGKLATTTTKVTNAADKAALYLGSVLASKASFYKTTLGGVEKCAGGGLLTIVLAIIGAIIGAIVSWGTAWYLGAILGAAIGGAIGGALTYQTAEGFMMGAIQGAMIGASIAAGAELGIEIGYALAVGSAATSTALSSLTAGAIACAVGAVVGAAVAAGVTVYNALTQENMRAAAIDSMVRMLNGLPESIKYKEMALLQALLNSVDDPTMVQDTSDSDYDGNTDERVPALQVQWAAHAAEMKQCAGLSGIGLVNNFFNTYLGPWYEENKGYLSLLETGEIECACNNAEGEDITTEGPLIGLLRHIEAGECGDLYQTSWESGPTKEAWLAWHQDPCHGGCGEPPAGGGIDIVDFTRLHFQEFNDYCKVLLNPVYVPDMSEYGTGQPIFMGYKFDPEPLANLPDAWLSFLYDDQDPVTGNYRQDFYHVLEQKIIPELQVLVDEVNTVRDTLPGCQLVYGNYTMERNVQLLDSGLDTAGAGCQAYNPNPRPGTTASYIYPCHWQHESADIPDAAYFPNPLCKIGDAEKAQLIAEAGAVEGGITSSDNYINEQLDVTVVDHCTDKGGTQVAIDIIGGTMGLDADEASGELMHTSCSNKPLGGHQNLLSWAVLLHYTCEVITPGEPGSLRDCQTYSDGTQELDNVCEPFDDGQCCNPPEDTITYPEFDQDIRESSGIDAPDLFIPVTEMDTDLSDGTYWSAFRAKLQALSDRVDEVTQEGTFATTDQDEQDEFGEGIGKLEEGIINITTIYMPALQNFHNEMQALQQKWAACRNREYNYTWTDSSADHKVTINVGNFRIPEIKKKEEDTFLNLGLAKKTCVTLYNYSDDGTQGTWVKIRRDDEASHVGGAVDMDWRGSNVTRCSQVRWDQDGRVAVAHTTCP